ncbi:uncharacterized protein LOC125675717 [Ostrea edulis]|uniref:uncharacterized protein LOC125675717 n=1 Tax=Ostrea edulis TaxID=37623 RepID=UPI0024AFC92A|nr:uncharacterized protein LOC125675717 [Ostrea edulis]
MASLKTSIRCSFPNWCSKCGVLHVNVSNIEEIQIDSSNCSRFYENPFPFEIRHPQGVLKGGRRCCEGTLTVHYNVTKKIEARGLQIFTEIQSETTQTVGNETYPVTVNSHHPNLPAIVSAGAGYGGVFLFIVCAVLVFVWRRVSQKVKSCKYKVPKSDPFDTIQNDYNPVDSHYENTVNHAITNRNHSNRAPVANPVILELQGTLQRPTELNNTAPKAHVLASSSDQDISTDEPDYVNTEGYLNLNNLQSPPCRGVTARCHDSSTFLHKVLQRRYQSDIADNAIPHLYVEVIK